MILFIYIISQTRSSGEKEFCFKRIGRLQTGQSQVYARYE